MDGALWRAGASFYAEEEYARFKQTLKDGRERLAREQAKFGWFRNHKILQTEFQDILRSGEVLLQNIQDFKASKSKHISDLAESLLARVERLKQMTEYFNENDEVRKSLAQAEIKLTEAGLLIGKESFEPAGDNLAKSETYIEKAEQAMTSLLERYLSKSQLEKWQKWAEETVAESKAKGTVAIVVNKLERKLTIYRNGIAEGVYDVGLGRYGLSDKLYSGDEATPEGKYQIIKKIPSSRFYKAVLINYPNDEDQKAFALAKKNGRVPARAAIGGSIEIHGGGKDSITAGCVGLENKDMDEIYGLVRIGTPVTIVGAVSVENSILAEIKKFDKNG